MSKGIVEYLTDQAQVIRRLAKNSTNRKLALALVAVYERGLRDGVELQIALKRKQEEDNVKTDSASSSDSSGEE